jgi:hypothetical protein
VKKIKILLTFDYELPLGHSVDYRAGLFEPADALLRRADSIGVPVVLFADVCSAIRFETWDKQGYYYPFVQQLRQYLVKKHDVQLHIHPHWMTSSFDNRVYVPSSDFSLSQFSRVKQGHNIESVITAAYQELVKIGKSATADYRCIAYRAGGYDVEPESARILQQLSKLGVVIDSSVIKEYYLDYNFSHIDYSGAPKASAWYVSTAGPLLKPVQKGILELPITSMPVGIWNIARRRMKKITQGRRLASRIYHNRGKGFAAQIGKQSIGGVLRKIFNPIVLSLDKEYLEASDLLDIVDYNVRRYNDEERDLILTAIGHPKSMGSYHLDLMEQFVNGIRAKYGDAASFITYPQIGNSLHVKMD